MTKKKKQKKDKKSNVKRKIVDVDKLKAFGIITDSPDGGIEEVDGSDVSGGKDNNADTTVDTHWPTTASS